MLFRYKFYDFKIFHSPIFIVLRNDMNNKKTGLLFVLIAITLLPSCKSIKEPELKGIEKVRVNRFGFKESNLDFEILLFNPNNHRLKLKNAIAEVWLDGNPLGNFTIDTLIHIPAKGDFRLPVQMKMDMRHFVENMAAAFMDKLVTLNVKGMAKAGKGLVYINYPLSFDKKLKISEFIK